MPARILTVLLIILLALPMTAVLPPASAGTRLQEQAAPTLAAKKKPKKNKPKFKTVTRTVRQPVTQTFTNPATITHPASGEGAITGSPADPYPSTISVNGFVNGRILDIDLSLIGYTQTEADNADVLLAATHLATLNAIVMSDAGGNENPSNVSVTLDDQAAASLPEGTALVSGRFRPTNHGVAVDVFPPDAPTPSGNSALSVFNGSDPNGTWQLFVVDDEDQDTGSFTGGWALQITAESDVQVQKRVKIKKDKKKG